jgi:hypothetical protein
MAEFRALYEYEKPQYSKRYEGALVFDSAEELAAIHLAAQAKIAYQQEYDQTPSEVDKFFANIDPAPADLYMNRSDAATYPEYLRDYAEWGFMYKLDGEELDVGACRVRAEELAADIELALQVYDIVRATDFDAAIQMLWQIAHPEWDENESRELLGTPASEG